jgi:hypothetical protein
MLLRSLPIALLLPFLGCGRRDSPESPLAPGTPAIPGQELLRLEAPKDLVVERIEPEVLARIAGEPRTPAEALVALGGPLQVKIAWETQDDPFFARRYVVAVRVTVAAVDGARCTIQKFAREPGSLPETLLFGAQFQCLHRGALQDVGIFPGTLTAAGFDADPSVTVRSSSPRRSPPARPSVALEGPLGPADERTIAAGAAFLAHAPAAKLCLLHRSDATTALVDARIDEITSRLRKSLPNVDRRLVWGSGTDPKLPVGKVVFYPGDSCTPPSR